MKTLQDLDKISQELKVEYEAVGCPDRENWRNIAKRKLLVAIDAALNEENITSTDKGELVIFKKYLDDKEQAYGFFFSFSDLLVNRLTDYTEHALSERWGLSIPVLKHLIDADVWRRRGPDSLRAGLEAFSVQTYV